MRPIEQIKRALDADSRSGISSMAPIGCESQGLIVRSWVAYSGAIAPEALQAVGLMAEDRRDVGLLAITSADRLTPDGPPRSGRAKVASSIPARTSSGFWRAGCRAGHRTRFLGISDEPARWSIFTGTMASVPTLSSPRHNLPPSEGPLKVAATRCMRRSCVELLESCNDTERLRVIRRHASLRRGDAWRHVALRTNIRYGSALNRFKKSRPPPQPLLSANSTDRRHAASVTWSQPGARQAENA